MNDRFLRSITEWRQRERAAFERMYQTMAAASRAASEVTTTVTTPDEGIEIEITGDSRVRAIKIDRNAYDRYDSEVLSNLVIAGVAAARREVKQKQLDVFNEIAKAPEGNQNGNRS